MYDSYGNDQWKNYLHQTVSKNGLLIYDPSENMGKNSVNDGGQRWPQGSDHPKNLDVLLTKDYKMGEVTAYEFGPDAIIPEYSYISGDITNAYSSQKVSRVKRSTVTFNTQDEKYPCIFVVMDRVDSTDPDFKKTWLLHFIQEPEISGKAVTIIRDGQNYRGGEYGGKMVVNNLLPDKVNIIKIGGPGKEFWVDSVQTNYPAAVRNKAAEPGAWQIQISPAVKNRSDVFLNVLSVMDKATPSGPEVEKLENGDLIGTKSLNMAVLFSRSGIKLEKAEFHIDDENVTKMLVCDLTPGVWSVMKDNVEMGKYRVSEDGKCLYLKVMLGKYSIKLEEQ